jgi:mannosyltransferase OCH1-like enzyme
MEILCINSYLANGHEFHLYTYSDIANVPNGTIVKDAGSIIPEKDIYVDCFGGYVNLANQFRFTLLFKLGGWWVDMDSVCLKPFDFKEDFVFSSEMTNDYERHYTINNTFIKSKPGAKFLKDCLDFLSIRGHEYIHWGELGITLLSRMIFRNRLEQFIKYPEYFCPVSYHNFNHLIGNSSYVLPEISYALHWWNEMWRRKGIDKNAKFPEKSLYETLKSKYNNISKIV